MDVLTSVRILSPSRGSEIKRLTSSGMSLATEWMAVTFHATFFGPHGLLNNPSGALMPGRAIGCLEPLHENKFSLTQGAYQLKGRHLRKRVESIRTWVLERRGSGAESGWSGVPDDEQTKLQQALLQ